MPRALLTVMMPLLNWGKEANVSQVLALIQDTYRRTTGVGETVFLNQFLEPAALIWSDQR